LPVQILIMQKLATQDLPPFVVGGKTFHSNGDNGERPPIKTVKLRFHGDGTVSIRINGHWIHGQQLDHRLFLSLPGATRQSVMKRVVKKEYQEGRSYITGSHILVTHQAERSDTN
jgi:hypothetical protein